MLVSCMAAHLGCAPKVKQDFCLECVGQHGIRLSRPGKITCEGGSAFYFHTPGEGDVWSTIAVEIERRRRSRRGLQSILSQQRQRSCDSLWPQNCK
eukprot:COSAG01_NODE_762_length_13792_cov_19.126707_17_plen_96_part_00